MPLGIGRARIPAQRGLKPKDASNDVGCLNGRARIPAQRGLKLSGRWIEIEASATGRARIPAQRGLKQLAHDVGRIGSGHARILSQRGLKRLIQFKQGRAVGPCPHPRSEGMG